MSHHTGRANSTQKSTSNHSEMESDSAYGPGEDADVVTTACRIVDDEPQPMRNMKKANRVPTAAEQFSSDHQGEYEARAKPSGDKVGRVERHNQVYPKLRDELDKKSSISRVVAVTMSRKDALKLTNVNSTRDKKNTRPSTRAYRRRSRTRKPKIRKTLTKRKKPNRTTCNRSHRLSKYWNSKGCQCHVGGHSNLKEMNDNSNDVVVWARNLNRKSRMSQGSRGSDKFQGTSEPTVSSYHSFSSMEQEPMV